MLNKNSIHLFCFLLLAALFGPAHSAYAQTSSLYFAGYLGLSTFNDQDFSENTVPAAGDLEFKNGMNFAGALGIRISEVLRLEAEVNYGRTDIDRADLGNGASIELGGELTSYIGMVNIIYDFNVPWDVRPFLTAGLGYGFFEGEVNDGTGTLSNISEDSDGLVYQVGGGLKYRVSPVMALTGGYRYLGADDLDFDSYNIDYSSHEFRIGLEYDLPAE